MTLAEKIQALRTARGLSQGDLAEHLEVSRQSVSKWETGQATPDLDKIIKLADLFGVTVDELVREEKRAQPPQAEPQVVYVEHRTGLRPAQIVGTVFEGMGCLFLLLGFAVYPGLLWGGVVLMPAGLPLLLAKKHPWLISGWVLVGLAYLILNPWTSSVDLKIALWELREGFFTMRAIIALTRFAALVFMLVCTGYAINKEKQRKGDG